jgi:hypothetical protein
MFEGTEFGAGSLAGNKHNRRILVCTGADPHVQVPSNCCGKRPDSLCHLPAAIPVPRVPAPFPSGVAGAMESARSATRNFRLGWMVDYGNPRHRICGIHLLPQPHTQPTIP